MNHFIDEVIEKIRALKLIKNIRINRKALVISLISGIVTTHSIKVKAKRKLQ